MLDFNNKSICIFGLPDGGKSTLTNYLLSQYGAAAFIYDTLHEFPDHPFDRYRPKNRESVEEYCGVIQAVIKSKKYRVFATDESNRYCPSKPAPLPQAVADLNDWRAHYGLSTIYICRRPVQLNQDITETANHLIIFGMDGRNNIKFLNDLSDGLGDAVTKLPKFHFAVYTTGAGYEIYNPIPREFATSKKM